MTEDKGAVATDWDLSQNFMLVEVLSCQKFALWRQLSNKKLM